MGGKMKSIKNSKKVVAVILALLMVVGVMPMDSFVKTVSAETTRTTGTTFVLDASTLNADDFGGYDVKLAEDKVVGTEGFFTVKAAGSKNSLKNRADSPINADNGTYTQAVL